MTWEPRGLQRLLFRRSESGGWHWTRRAVFVYTLFARKERS